MTLHKKCILTWWVNLHYHQQHVGWMTGEPGKRWAGYKWEMEHGWISCITPQILPVSYPSLPFLLHFPAIYSSSLAWNGQWCCLNDWWTEPFTVHSEQDHQGKIMQFENLTERSWQAPDLAAAPCCFQGRFSQTRKRNRELRRSSSCTSSAARHRTKNQKGAIYYLPWRNKPKPIWFRPNRIVPKMSDRTGKEMEISMVSD